jgi:hypothetical protein
VSNAAWPDLPVVTKEEADRDPEPKEGRIVVPNEQEREYYLARAHNNERCGDCAHFLHSQGQHELKEQEVFKRIFEELKHDPAWYGRLDLFGLCDQWEGHMCAVMTPATIPLQFLDSEAPYEVRDTPQKCPQFRKKSGGALQSKRSFIGKRRNFEE